MFCRTTAKDSSKCRGHKRNPHADHQTKVLMKVKGRPRISEDPGEGGGTKDNGGPRTGSRGRERACGETGATCMRCFNGNLTFDHRYMVRSDVVLADDQEDVATGWPASGTQAVRGSSPRPCAGPVHLPSSCRKVPKGAGLS